MAALKILSPGKMSIKISQTENIEAKNQVQTFTLKVTEKTNQWTFNLSPISKAKL